MDELLMERYALAKERVCEIKEEKAVQMPYLDFFQKTAAFLEKNVEIMDGVVFLGETREPRKLADAADLSIDCLLYTSNHFTVPLFILSYLHKK